MSVIDFFAWMFPIGAVIGFLAMIVLVIDCLCPSLWRVSILDKIFFIMVVIWFGLWMIGGIGLFCMFVRHIIYNYVL